MKIIYMGTPEFAVPCLEMLIDSGHEIVGVFTQPDKPSGRGQKMNRTPVKEKALAHNIPVFQPHTLRDTNVMNEIENLKPDLIVVVAYGQILPKAILELPKHGCINVHASLLPKYRGAGPINWVIINGEKKTGITTMYMDVGLDKGDMILKEEVEIGAEETAGELHDRLMHLGAQVLRKTIGLIENNEITAIPQNHSESTYAPILTKDLGKIDWSQSAIEIKNLIRGTIPWPTAFTFYEGQVMKIWKSTVIESELQEVPGKIIDVKKDCILVATGQNILSIEEIQFSGKKRMGVRDYLVGNAIEKGNILGE
ncbi:methionyl-tRNA formyltransferase [Alkaliphilus oremlandii]|uniref:Methionyl-tRNA formyltransferase n=1 Tax=Alkaliphilus oremlandii (strain OhILAs) TaxID=350688 RepID=FMT_ALKOO|nr:methionyl-tRNA formyltransferase [Alkaliphilus oremlandii]A8MH85.1 RecName: Full=Methionyl-tRNA formyltransferase [Alkaliphilus oremlandii OhILAs]ABW18972.1 methionyl-tRNA formyltransferase [Alkaliphilus oremlandii OhILAs]